MAPQTYPDQYPRKAGVPFDKTNSQSVPKGPSLTKQSFKKETDINHILAKYSKTGKLPEMIKENPQYGSYIDVPTYLEAMTQVAFAKEQFANLSADQRARFNNDPASFLSFATDEQNVPEMVKLGLSVKPPLPAPGNGSVEPEPAEPLAAEPASNPAPDA